MMRELPDGQSLLIRSDYTDNGVWRDVVAAVNQPWALGNGRYSQANLTLVDDIAFDGVTADDVVALLGRVRSYAFVADERTMTVPEHPILAINNNPYDPEYRQLRVLPSELAGIENNLSIANMDFSSFAASADKDGVFRGFKQQEYIDRDLLIEPASISSASPALAGFFEALVASDMRRIGCRQYPDIRSCNEYVKGNDYSRAEELIGINEYLDVTAKGGPGVGVSIPIDRGYWSAILDPRTLVPRAAMMLRMPRRPPVQAP